MDGGHDQDVGRVRQAHERVVGPLVRIEGDLRWHLAFVFEVDVHLVEHVHGVAHLHGALAHGVAEGGIGHECHPGREAQLAHRAGGLAGDLHQLVRLGHLGDIGVGDEQGAALGQQDRHAHDTSPRRRVDDAEHFLQHLVVVAGDPGHHPVGVAQGDHGGGEGVAVLVDQPLDVAQQVAIPLQPGVESLDELRIAGRDPGVDDLQAGVGGIEPHQAHVLVHQLIAADQYGLAQALGLEGVGGADHAGLLALGEDDTLVGRRHHRAGNLLHEAGGGIDPLGQRGAVGVHVLDGFARDPGVHGRLGHIGRYVPDQPGVEGRRDDILRPELQHLAVIGGGDLVGHVLPGQLGQGVGAGDLHLVVHPAGAHVQGAAEDVGKAQDIVDLVRIVRPAGGHDRVIADGGDFLR